MFILHPDLYLTPSYRISPFKTDDVRRNASMVDDDFAVDYFNKRFGKEKWQYTYSGKDAIKCALMNYGLKTTDLVTILTTSQNFYISSCVTNEIESFCRWNRELVPETKVIFVNHEFGYPYPDMEKLVASGLPIIEDCCTTFFSQDEVGAVGQYGDFSVYSFPKFFPLQIGGLLLNNTDNAVNKSVALSEHEEKHIQNSMSYYLKMDTSILKARKENWDYAINRFSKLGLTPRFDENSKTIPSVLLLRNNGIIKDLNKLKSFISSHGIQNSTFYGEDAFFIPIHQNLSTADIDYFYEVIFFFCREWNNENNLSR